jgi:hypothetical protein
VITAQVFFMTFGSVPRVFPDDLCEGFVKFHFWESIAGLLLGGDPFDGPPES